MAEIEAYLGFLDAVDAAARLGPPRLRAEGPLITPQQQQILHAGVFVQLYNLVEATVVGCIDAVTNRALDGGSWRPADLSAELLGEWIRVMARTHDDLNPEHRFKYVKELCDHLIEGRPLAGFAVEKGSGGNWDDIQIEKMARRLGISLDIHPDTATAVKRHVRDDLGAMGIIKKLRNQLAHGNISFAECGQNTTSVELRQIAEITTKYMREVVVSFVLCINGHGYILPSKRPPP